MPIEVSIESLWLGLNLLLEPIQIDLHIPHCLDRHGLICFVLFLLDDILDLLGRSFLGQHREVFVLYLFLLPERLLILGVAEVFLLLSEHIELLFLFYLGLLNIISAAFGIIVPHIWRVQFVTIGCLFKLQFCVLYFLLFSGFY